MTRPGPPKTGSNPATRPVRPEAGAYRRLPELVDIEGDSYVFLALLERLSPGDTSVWLLQTFRVDPNDGGADELVVSVSERCRADARADPVAFDDQYTLEVPFDGASPPLRPDSVGDALASQYVVCEGCRQHSSARILDDEVALFTPDRWCECETGNLSGECASPTPERTRVD